jgi:hypothetical protein
MNAAVCATARASMQKTLHRWSVVLIIAMLALACGTPAASAAPAGNGAPAPPASAAAARGPYSTALHYAIRFYPRFLTYFQQTLSKPNRPTGPSSMGPAYGLVVAPNVDTVYGEFFLDLSKGPQIFTIPSTNVTYSLLTLDVWGNVLQTSINGAGTYALVRRGWRGHLPPGVTHVVAVPYRMTIWIIRADNFSSSGQDQSAEATAFRNSLRLASVQAYRQDPSSGVTTVLPLVAFSPQMKTIADQTIESQPTTFFRDLQRAMHSPTTSPVTRSDRRLSRAFDRAVAAANLAARRGNDKALSQIINAAHVAHAMIINRWQSKLDRNHWVYFDNVGQWGTAYLDRAALTEYIQYGNNASAAGYYDAFTDAFGIPLDGSVIPAYRLTFAKTQIPQAKRFWSLTAYIPPGVTLFPNPANKYVVGSYTPGLQTNRDGSITIYIQPTPPVRAPLANWLPVPSGPFSLLLRVYGPEKNTARGRYIPPKIRPLGLP